MEGKKAVSNTSSIIYLAKLDLFNLCKNMFSKILIPSEVINEIFKKDEPENIIVKKVMEEGFIKEIQVNDVKDFPLHEGEKAAISLCLEKNIPIFLSDDKRARKIANSTGIEVTGMIGIILWNLENKKIEKENCRELLNKLIEKGYFLSNHLYYKIINFIDSHIRKQKVYK